MTDTKALDALIEAVEAGNLQHKPYGGMPMATACYPRDRDGRMMPETGGWNDGAAVSAYHGSLDAAKALHEALLPGWDYRTGRDGDDYHALVFRSGRMEEHADDWQMCPNDPARAWLLSILKAYRAGL